MLELLKEFKRLDSLSPTNAERISGWVAFAWAVVCLLNVTDTHTGSYTYRALVNILPSVYWLWFFATLWAIQVFGCLIFYPYPELNKMVKLGGLWMAFMVWSFLGFHTIQAYNYGPTPTWGIYLVLAWSQACKIAVVFRGDRRG